MTHLVFFKKGFYLAVAAVTGQNDHFSAALPDLFNFFPAINETFFLVGGLQGSPTPSAAILSDLVRIQGYPFRCTLIQNPSRFFIKTVAEKFFRLSTVIAGVMIRNTAGDFCFIHFDAAGFDIIHQKVKDRDRAESIKKIREPFLQPVPGRQIRVPSLRIHKVLDLKLLHMFYNPAYKDFHGLIIA
jgi:hypothetical protein